MQAVSPEIRDIMDQLNKLILSGNVAVSNFPLSQTVSGNFYPATQPVSGTFWPATQPVSIASLPVAPIPQVGTATIAVSAFIAQASVKIIDANANRKGLILYNNGANSIYLALGVAANSSNSMTFILATFAHLILPSPIYTVAIYGIRNAGSGTVLATELT